MKQLYLLLLLASVSAGLSAGELIRTQGERVDGQYLVVFKDGFPAEQMAAQLAGIQGTKVLRVWKSGLNGAAFSNMTESQAIALARNPTVAWVEEDAVFKIDVRIARDKPDGAAEKAAQYQYNPVWGLNRIDQRTLPLNGTYIYDSESDGDGIHAYVIDTGIRDSHNEFESRASRDFDAIGDGQNGNDCHGHGTHVAGTLGGKTYGVAKKVRLHAIRVFDCDGDATATSIVDGVNWVTANAVTPAVANMSLWGPTSVTLDTAVNNSVDSGIFYSVIAGNNDGQNACNYSPSRAAKAYTVASTTSSDSRSSFSNLGNCVDIFAPGSAVTSAWHTSDSATEVLDGTSMAAPHVAGVASRILDEHSGFTVTQIKNELDATASCGVVSNAGSGSPNLLVYRKGLGHRMGLRVEAILFAGRRASLTWGGSCVANVDIFRDGVKITTTANDGFHMDFIGGSGSGSFNYWVCEAGSTTWYNTATCSNVATAAF